MGQKILALYIDEKVCLTGGTANSLRRCQNPMVCDMDNRSYNLQWSELGWTLVSFSLVKYSIVKRVFSYLMIMNHYQHNSRFNSTSDVSRTMERIMFDCLQDGYLSF